MPCVLSLTPDGNARALDLLERAMERDPDTRWRRRSPPGHMDSALFIISPPRRTRIAREAPNWLERRRISAADAIRACISATPSLPARPRRSGSGDPQGAFDRGGSAWAWSRSGWIDVYQWRCRIGIERFKIALDLAPDDCLAFNSMSESAARILRPAAISKAADWQRRALAEHPSASWIHRTMCPAYVLVGANPRLVAASRPCGKAIRGLTISDLQQGMPPLPEPYCDRVLDALHSVGLPL